MSATRAQCDCFAVVEADQRCADAVSAVMTVSLFKAARGTPDRSQRSVAVGAGRTTWNFTPVWASSCWTSRQKFYTCPMAYRLETGPDCIRQVCVDHEDLGARKPMIPLPKGLPTTRPAGPQERGHGRERGGVLRTVPIPADAPVMEAPFSKLEFDTGYSLTIEPSTRLGAGRPFQWCMAQLFYINEKKGVIR